MLRPIDQPAGDGDGGRELAGGGPIGPARFVADVGGQHERWHHLNRRFRADLVDGGIDAALRNAEYWARVSDGRAFLRFRCSQSAADQPSGKNFDSVSMSIIPPPRRGVLSRGPPPCRRTSVGEDVATWPLGALRTGMEIGDRVVRRGRLRDGVAGAELSRPHGRSRPVVGKIPIVDATSANTVRPDSWERNGRRLCDNCILRPLPLPLATVRKNPTEES
jgi:hypothetical protein